MRTLYLCRHAKSSWADPGQDDFDRPLNERGERDAPIMAQRTKQYGAPVDLIVTSHANRALSTARAFASELGLSGDALKQDVRLYHASPQTIAKVVSELPDSARRVMLFGHNPGFSEAVDYFCGDGVGDMPTCGIVRIDMVANEWKETGRDLGTLVWFDYPKRSEDNG
ncbi:MAG: histidine phosphatase family protein [Flavobacteriales bacterium]|nr:histidine phosphatase family protein [Flavobacteriales bacterium]